MPTEIRQLSHAEQIRQMFGRVAKRYDLANTILSMGIHHQWRKTLVKLSRAQGNMKVLDCATGTGDLAIEFCKKLDQRSEVIGCDFCVEMMESAPSKAKQNGFEIKFEQGDVMKLNYPDSYFDISSIAFGIRNVQDAKIAISEMARVTKPGGRVMVLEFGQSTLPVFDKAYEFYSSKVLPYIGGMITGQREAYEYLQKSSAKFPCREEFVQLMQSTNSFSHVHFKSLTGGIAYIYSGIKKI